jgi:iron complex transport system ATP-binding protein
LAATGLLPASGRITLDGADLKKMKRKDIAKNIALMSQISTIYFSYTVFETVMLGRYVHFKAGVFGEPQQSDREAVERSLAAVGLLELAGKQIADLSGGQLQRVFLARTLAQEPKLILLDEPTNHLDLKHQIELVEYLKKWSKSSGHAVIGVLHDINLAMRLADKILLMRDGAAIAYGNAEAVLRSETLSKVYDMDIREYMLGVLAQWQNNA